MKWKCPARNRHDGRHTWAWDEKNPRVGRCIHCPATTRFSKRKIAWLRDMIANGCDFMVSMPKGWPT